MASKAALTRLQKEYKAILKEPVPSITAHPAPNNILEWHFVLEGQKDSEYEGGVYHGKVTFPSQYPYKPPSIQMLTPSGRFATNTRLCLSMSDFHPESWNPMWSVSTILLGLQSFMYDTAHTTGAITTTRADKERFARESLAFNMRNPTFKKLFPEWVEKWQQQQRAAKQHAQQPRAEPGAQPAPAALTVQAPPQPPQPPPEQQHGQPANGQRPLQKQEQEEQRHRGQQQQRAAPAALGWQGWALGAVGVAALGVLLAAVSSLHSS